MSSRRTLPFVAVSLLVLASPAALHAQPTPAGPPFPVSAEPVTVTPAPVVVAGPLGEGLYLWIGECGEEVALCGRGFGEDGEPLGPETQLLPSTVVLDAVPSAAAAPDGTVWLVWSRPGAGFAREVVARRFAMDGTALGLEVVVASQPAQVYAEPGVAVDASGRVVFVWERQRFEGADEAGAPIFTGVEILARERLASGQLRAVVRIDEAPGALVSSPAVAAGSDGGWLVAWQSFAFGPEEDDVLVRHLEPGPSGPVPGPILRAHLNAAGRQVRPAAAASGQGTYLVAWQGPRTGGQQGIGAFVRFFRGSQALFPAEIGVGTGVSDRTTPDAAGADDAFAVVWLDGRFGGSVWGQRWSAEGTPLGLDFRIDETAAGAPAHPAVGAFGGPGAASGLWAGWTVVADDFGRSVHGRRYPGQVAPPEPCVPSDTVLCLGAGDRFRVTATWATGEGTAGEGRAEPLTVDTGWFWFFRDTNLELIVKVLDGCPVNGRFWVFAGGLTDVAVELVVEDTAAGGRRAYSNPQGTPFRPIQDTGAFPCP